MNRTLAVGLLLALTASLPAFASAPLPIGDLSGPAFVGWTAEGAAWEMTTRPRPGASGYHAESLARGEGERGTLRSDPFVIQGTVISFLANGWSGRHGERGLSWFALRRASDGKVLRRAAPPNTDTLTAISWPVAELVGERVVMEAVDTDPGQAFAWLGLTKVRQELLPTTRLRPLPLAGRGTWGVLTFNGARQQVPPYFSSLGGGERGTGVLRSPEFVVASDVITFELCGHDGQVGDQHSNYACLRDSQTGETLRITYAPGNDALQPCRWDTRELRGRRVWFEVCDGISGDGYAWLGCDNVDAGPALRLHLTERRWPAGWQVPEAQAGHYITACGVPFLALPPRATAAAEGQRVRLECGFQARRLYFLGMIGMPDRGVPCWLPWNPAERLFLGDRLGSVIIEYTDRARDTVDLVYGRTAWWYAVYTGMGATEPFASNPAARRVLADCLDLFPTGGADGHAYLLAVAPRAKPIRALWLVDNPDKTGVPVVTAISAEPVSHPGALGAPLPARPATAAERAWLARHCVQAGRVPDKQAASRLQALRRVLYTCADDLKRPVAPDPPARFRGPRVTFQGEQGVSTPALLQGLYYHSLQDMDDKVEADGTFHTSTRGAPSWGGYEGFGAWHPSYGAYYDHAWSRDLGRVLGELAEWGYEDDAQACALWCNKWLGYLPAQFPRIQVAGQPVPGHWVRIINHPEWMQTPGMPERFGNLENDGHGLIMLFQYRAWLHAGQTPEWVSARWEGVRMAAEYICWLLDHPEISRAHDDVLFSESEGGMGTSIYCDVPCLLGLRAYADMARAAGKREEAARWTAYADRLEAGIGRYYAAEEQGWGPVWDITKGAVWPFHHATLAPALIWPDYHGFDLANMPPDWLERTRNTLRRQLAACRPHHASGVAMGYGQSFITQAALLLDEMEEASGCVARLAALTYFPGHQPYIVPEGVEITPDGRWWHRTGDLGNAVQEGEALKCVRIIVGIDDTNPARLRLMPRLPQRWRSLGVRDYPAMVQAEDRATKRRLAFSYRRQRANEYQLELAADGPLPALRLRLGPFRSGVHAVTVTTREEFERQWTLIPYRSGDSMWAWLQIPPGRERVVLSAVGK